MVMNAANLPGRTVPHHLAGYFGINKLMSPSTLICAAVIFAFVVVIVVAIIYGFASISGACTKPSFSCPFALQIFPSWR